jgi:hypothetical protein
MSRRDLAADLDRPHFYSQFWIDVAMGKRDASAATAVEVEAEIEPDMLDELDEAELEPVAKAPARKPAKPPEKRPEPARPTITSLADLANIDLLMKSSAEMEGDEVPDIETGPASDLAPIVTDFDVEDAAAEPEVAAAEEEDLGEGDFDEEEEEDEWGSRRKPSKPQKQERRRERPDRGRPF